MRRSAQRAPLFFPLTLVLVGVVILLNNFLLIEADIVSLWPLIFIIIGLQLLWRGDLAPSWEAHSFGITRGSVESASLEISSAEIDVRLHALDRAGRLIAGQYTARSRPRLAVRNNHATLTLRRGNTWLFSFADWDLGLAQDIPWAVLMTAHLGVLQADLRGLLLREATIASGIGDVKVVLPNQPSGIISIRSTFGDLHLTAPQGIPLVIHIQASPLCRVVADTQYFIADGNRYLSPTYIPGSVAIEVTAAATFGNILLNSLAS